MSPPLVRLDATLLGGHLITKQTIRGLTRAAAGALIGSCRPAPVAALSVAAAAEDRRTDLAEERG